jgi:hypothetical protein
MKTGVRNLIAVGSLSALLLGAVTLAPVRADDYQSTRNAIRRDIVSIRNDQAHIKALTHKKNDQLLHRDWRNARGTDQRLGYARMDLRRDQALLRADQRAMAHLHR